MTQIWEYIKAVAEEKDTNKILKELYNKHLGTEHEADFLEYELNILAQTIVNNDNYKGFKSFMLGYDVKMQNAIYEVGLDSFIFKLEG